MSEGLGGSASTMTNFLMSWIITLTANTMLDWSEGGTFTIYTVFAVLTGVFVAMFLPERPKAGLLRKSNHLLDKTGHETDVYSRLYTFISLAASPLYLLKQTMGAQICLQLFVFVLCSYLTC